MNRAPFISVCIPAYRRTEFLKRLLDSLAIQTYPDFEIVLTDDSPDESVSTLVAAHPLADRVRYFKNPVALGTPENWNEGLRQARGEWIKIMHDDDWFSRPDSLEQFAGTAKGNAAAFIFSAYLNVLPDGRTEQPFSPDFSSKKLSELPEVLMASNRIGPPSVVLFRAKPGFQFDRRMKWLVDIDFYIRYLKQFPPAVYLKEPLVNIGISESQVTQSSFGNPSVEIPERMLLGEKLGYSSADNWMIYDSWWRFIRNLEIRSEEQITGVASNSLIPKFLSNIIRIQKRLPHAVLKIGIVSKFLMSGSFVMEKLKKGNLPGANL